MESHVDIQLLNESVCEKQAACVLQMIVEPLVVLVKPVVFAIRPRRFHAVDSGAFFTLIVFFRQQEVHMQRTKDQTRTGHSENSLVSAPASRAGSNRFEIEKRRIKQFAFAD